jgi:hypothetical protein
MIGLEYVIIVIGTIGLIIAIAADDWNKRNKN